MSYDRSYGTPPRQERWPQATPAEGWTPPRDGEGEWAGRPVTRAQRVAGSHRRQSAPPSSVATAAFPVAGDGYGTADSYPVAGGYDTGGYDTGGYRTVGYPGGGYAGSTDGFDGDPDGHTAVGPGYGQATDGRVADGYGWADMGYAGSPDGYAATRDGYAGTQNGYDRTQNGYDRTQNGYDRTQNGYGRTGNGYDRTASGYPSDLGQGPSDFPGGGAYLGPGSYTETAYSDPGYSSAGYSGPGYSEAGYSDAGYSEAGYSSPGYSGSGYSEAGYSGSGYFEGEYSDLEFGAPDAGVHPDGWLAEQARRRAASHRGPMVSAATEFLATGVVIGVSTLAAGVLKSPVSPVSAMGAVFTDRMPAMLRSFAAHHFGTHGQTVLLLGMYAVIAVVAITIGAAARRATALGVAGVAAFALIAAFVTVTRPASHVADVMPAVIGGLAGVAALLWLVRASAPTQGLDDVTPLRPARGGSRRRTR